MFENLPFHARPPVAVPARETRATCESCVMARLDWPRDARDAGPFKKNLKCCTYDPFIPNFSLGRLLKIKPHLLTKTHGRLTPLGLLPEEREPAGGFGIDASKKCAFLEKGRCSIWSERPTVCRTYFCVSDQGHLGQTQWRKAEAIGNSAEWTLANETAWSLGFTPDEIENEQWAEWADRKEAYFIECAERAFDPALGQP